jgi:hypothetical protein
MTPSPVPPRIASGGNSLFARVAASICLAAPLLIFGLAGALRLLGSDLAGSQRSIIWFAFGGMSFLLVLAGLTMGILALCLSKRGHRTAVVCQSVAGLTLIGLLLALGMSGFLRARAASLARTKSYSDLTAASRDLNDKAIASLNNHQKDTVGLDHFQQTLDHAVENASGSDAQLLKASQAFTARVALLQKNYQQSVQELTAAKVLNTSNLVDRDMIQARRVLVQNFLQSNDELKDFTSHNEEMFRQELTRFNTPPRLIESTLEGFRQTAGARKNILLEIRGQDDTMGQDMLGVLDLLDTNWAQWSFNQSAGRVRFESQTALDRYNALLREIRQTAADQADSQKRLAAIIKQTSSQSQ